MIANHAQFIQAVRENTKVRIKFYSEADSGVLEHIFAALSYGSGVGFQDGLNRYWLWDYDAVSPQHTRGLLPQQIVTLSLLGETFDPVHLVETPPHLPPLSDGGASPGPDTGAGNMPATASNQAP